MATPPSPSSIQQQCLDLNRNILNVLNKSVAVNQLYEYIPRLMELIFENWFEVQDPKDLTHIAEFLGPTSHFMRFIMAYDNDAEFRTQINFRIDFLPYRTTQLIAAGAALPPLFSQKMKDSIARNKTDVTISIFEFYMFRFALYATTDRLKPVNRSGNGKTIDVYQYLLQEYLQFFFPIDSPSPSTFLSPQKSSNNGSRPPATLGHKFIQILIEFWWCKNITPKLKQLLQPYFANKKAPVDAYTLPSSGSLKYSKYMVKHIMCYLSSTSLSQPTAYSPNSLRRSSDNFEKPVLLQIIHEPLYDFLKMAFTQWPDTQQIVPQPLYSVIRLWLAYIAPWAYVSSYKPTKPLVKSQPNENFFTRARVQRSVKSRDPYSEKWKSHVFNNFLFYTLLLPHFLSRSNSVLRYNSNLLDVLELEKVVNIFKEEGLLVLINETEYLMSMHTQQVPPPATREQTEKLMRLRNQTEVLEGQPIPYAQLDRPETQVCAREIIRKLQEAARNGNLVHYLPPSVNIDKSSQAIEKRIANIISGLGTIIRIPDTEELARETQTEPSIVLRKMPSLDDLLPEMDQDLRLTQRGREQLKRGERKTSVLNPTPILGDPIALPVNSNEISFLVPFCNRASRHLSLYPKARQIYGDLQYVLFGTDTKTRDECEFEVSCLQALLCLASNFNYFNCTL